MSPEQKISLIATCFLAVCGFIILIKSLIGAVLDLTPREGKIIKLGYYQHKEREWGEEGIDIVTIKLRGGGITYGKYYTHEYLRTGDIIIFTVSYFYGYYAGNYENMPADIKGSIPTILIQKEM